MLFCSIIIISILLIGVMSIEWEFKLNPAPHHKCLTAKTQILSAALDPSRPISPTSYTHLLAVPVSQLLTHLQDVLYVFFSLSSFS